MRKYTLTENLISGALGVAIGLPLAIYGANHRTPPDIVQVEPVIYEEIATYNEEAEVIPEVYIMTEEDIAEEAYYDDLELLAMLVHAEAGNQDMIGRRLVAEVVLNRVDSDDFPDTIHEVIYQPNQFSPVGNGALDRAIPTEEDYEAVRLAIEYRLDRAILYFTGGGYGKYGTPAYQHGDHYFCTE